jgi:hypothetical protein
MQARSECIARVAEWGGKKAGHHMPSAVKHLDMEEARGRMGD